MSQGWAGSDDLALDAPTLVIGGSYPRIPGLIRSARLKAGPGCAIARDKGGNPVSLVLVVLGPEGAEEGAHAIVGPRCVIGRGPDCLIPEHPSKEAIEARREKRDRARKRKARGT